ncbi:MAG: redoxin family protein [Candidatus Harrisonbacteria bacterium]|nr:redoxin family protein [Candidatus Harrisonbacteria bacterium]
MNLPLRAIILAAVLALIAELIFSLENEKPKRAAVEGGEINIAAVPSQASLNKSSLYPRAVEITTPDGFVNTDKITISELIGKKVILVDFWTYSCINCQRTIPYLNSWQERYGDKGLVIIGVHTPEFEFEKKYENVLAAVKKFGIKYPVVLDNDYSTWLGYQNQYWPRKYLIDIDDFVVYDHIGEGAYAETEKKIQEALMERMAVLKENRGMAEKISKLEVVPDKDLTRPGSPEIYFGAFRNKYFANGVRGEIGVQSLSVSAEIKANNLYLSGDWDIQREYAENKSKNAKIIFRYQAKDVYFVASAKTLVGVRLLLDGQPLGKAAGEDVAVINGESYLTVQPDRLYKLVQDSEGYGEHALEMIIEDPGLRAFTFTFG